MAIGRSHWIAIAVEPDLKQEVSAALNTKNMTLKDWFLEQAVKPLLSINGSQKRTGNK